MVVTKTFKIQPKKKALLAATGAHRLYSTDVTNLLKKYKHVKCHIYILLIAFVYGGSLPIKGNIH